MKIFITGIAGFLGRHLADKFLNLGHEVIGCDDLSGGDLDNLPNGSIFYKIDCKNFYAIKEIFSKHKPEVIFHCAATPHEGFSIFSPSLITKNIFESSVSIFSAAIATKAKKIIFCSSMARYGSQNNPFYESFTPKPIDPYGIAKVASEDVLLTLCKVHEVNYSIAVPHNIVGPYQKYDDPYRNVMSIMLNRMLQNKPPIIYGDGEQTRCFSYIDDCITCLEQMAYDNNTNHQIINIGPDEGEVTINKLAELCANEVGFNGEPIYYKKGRPQEVRHATCNSDKARKLLNYKTKYSLQDAIRETAKYIRSRGPKDFKYYLDIEINNEKTPLTWTEKKF
tara:strand:- start:423 stop:1433 length:1011 start_codon:yes stop_codon:yes gene_type:complete